MLCRWGHSSSALWRHGPLTTTLPAQASALWRHGPLTTTPATPGLCFVEAWPPRHHPCQRRPLLWKKKKISPLALICLSYMIYHMQEAVQSNDILREIPGHFN